MLHKCYEITANVLPLMHKVMNRSEVLGAHHNMSAVGQSVIEVLYLVCYYVNECTGQGIIFSLGVLLILDRICCYL